MFFYVLTNELHFPLVDLADEEGILAIGGDLSSERLLLAYRSGIFPWYSEDEPIIWWAPNPRFVLFPNNFRFPKSLRPILRKNVFKITYDLAFKDVVEACASPRYEDDGTWITDAMSEAYLRLHKLGYAHSVEAWQDGKLVGGLYGVALGRMFFGESMFTHVSNASKVAFVHLVENLKKHHFCLIDSQVYTEHLERFGAEEIPRNAYMKALSFGLQYPDLKGSWTGLFN